MGRTGRLTLLMELVLTALVLVTGWPAAAQALGQPVTYYVNDDAAGTDDGTSWKNAFTDLQSALDAAVAGDSIWVAAGTYAPSLSIDGSADPRTASFSLKSGVALYGGFAGTEKQLDKRSADPALTVLSGDIGIAGDATDNSYHVVYANGVTGAVLDGFTVTLGRGDRPAYRHRDTQGAGMYNYESSLTVANCVFTDNRVDGKIYDSTAFGGGMYNFNSAPTVVDCTFTSNRAGDSGSKQWGRGGGMYNEGQFGSELDPQWPVVTGCTFTENFAWGLGGTLEPNGGGGMYNREGTQTIEDCTFKGNSAGYGGAMLNHMGMPIVTNCLFTANFNTFSQGYGGAIYNVARSTILNCTFYKNGWRLLPSGPEPRFRPYTLHGGAVYSLLGAGTITNCIFSDNAATARAGAIFYQVSRSAEELSNCLFYENISWQVNYNDREIDHVYGLPIWGGFTAYGNLYDVDPLLMDPAAGDFHLRYESPCIDTGLSLKQGNYIWPWRLPVIDFDGDKRVADGDGDGTPQADIGADEYILRLPGLLAFLTALSDAEEIDATLAARLLGYVDTASTALALDQEAAARAALYELIADAKATLGDTQTAQLIEMKTKAVIAEI